MTSEKLYFLQHTFPELTKKLKGDEVPEWGKMNPQQMIEHMSDSIRMATERNKQSIHTPAEQLPVYKNFLLSEKDFKPNTKNALMNETPPDIINPHLTDAITELENEIAYFIAFFESNPKKVTTNPIFGILNFEEWIQLLSKHAKHHLKQFRLI